MSVIQNQRDISDTKNVAMMKNKLGETIGIVINDTEFGDQIVLLTTEMDNLLAYLKEAIG